ncbi:MAG: hypothetical protein JNM59_00705 [Hyphomonadaceae bacterium]|nr:hypothetical protein [Hyphomonadaceae bacterium]
MRIVLTSLGFIAICTGAMAQTPEQSPGVLDQVYACASVTEEAARLACYDAAVGRLREAQSTGNLVAVDRQQAQELERDAFGFSLPSLGRLFRGGDSENSARPVIEEVAEMELVIERVAMRRDGTATFTMTNGQVWTQIDNESPRNARAGGAVTIRRATLGSFLMSVRAGGPALRVRRTQ